MIILDITKELFSITVYPGDPVSDKRKCLSIENGDVCNLTKLNLGSHLETHMDAPMHFMADRKDAAEVSLEKCIGRCHVVCHRGKIGLDF